MAEVIVKEEPKDAVQPDVVKESRTVRQINRSVLLLAWPVVLEQLLETAVGLADTLLVGRYSDAAVAGVGAAAQLFVLLIVGLSAVATGVTINVAQAIGAGDNARASFLTKQAIVWSLILSVPLSIAGIFGAGWLVSLLGIRDPLVAQIGADYLRVVMGAVVVLILLFTVGSALRGAGDSRTPMYVTLVANVINIPLAWLLIYGNFGFPELGPVGSAVAATVGRGVGLLLMLGVLLTGRKLFGAGGGRLINLRLPGGWRPQGGALWQIMRLGLPNAGQQLFTQLAFIFLIIIVAPIGTAALAAHNVIFNAFQLSFLPGFGFAIAATALVGQAVGARNEREARLAGNIATGWGLLWMSAIGLIYFAFAPQVLAAFVQDNEAGRAMVAAGTLPLMLVALVQPFWAILFVQSGALEGASIVLFPAIATVLAVYGAVGVGWWFAVGLGWGLAGVWGAFLLTGPLCLLVGWRFQTARLVRPDIDSAATLKENNL